jgi:hypothetical protein
MVVRKITYFDGTELSGYRSRGNCEKVFLSLTQFFFERLSLFSGSDEFWMKLATKQKKKEKGRLRRSKQGN